MEPNKMTPKIRLNDSDYKLIPIDELKSIQGRLKKISAHKFKELVDSIKKNGIIAPVVIYTNTINADQKEYFIIDGVHRIKALLHLRTENEFDGMVPCIEGVHKDSKTTYEALLSASSKYGKLNKSVFLKIEKNNDANNEIKKEVQYKKLDSAEDVQKNEQDVKEPSAKLNQGNIEVSTFPAVFYFTESEYKKVSKFLTYYKSKFAMETKEDAFLDILNTICDCEI